MATTQAEMQAEMENQQEPMPSSEQTTSASEESDSAALSEVSEQTAAEDLALPEDAKKRTAEQFDKLKQQLADERARRMEAEESLVSAYSQKPTSKENTSPLYDPTTGIVNIDELENLRTISKTATDRAQRAEQKLERYIVQEQEREAYTAYPELNPKDKSHDESLYKTTRALITDSLMNPKDYGNRELTMKEAAELALSLRDREVSKVKKETKEQTLEELTPKEQASLEVRGRSDQGERGSDLGDLRARSRRGDLDAIVERLRSIPSV